MPERSKNLKNSMLTESKDYYFENGLMVFTRSFLLKRGYCCNNGCKNCPYLFKSLMQTEQPNSNYD